MSTNVYKTASFFGHRKIDVTEELKKYLYEIIEDLITDKGVSVFLFGSKSEFNDLCYDTVTLLKEKHPHIRRIYVRAEYPDISDAYKRYLLQSYEDTFFPKSAKNAGRAVYIKRNFEMIDKSDYCIFYYIENNRPKGGTKIAFNYATKQLKNIINSQHQKIIEI